MTKDSQSFLQLLGRGVESHKSRERSMSPNGAKEVVFIFNGNEKDIEVEVDMTGIVPNLTDRF